MNLSLVSSEVALVGKFSLASVTLQVFLLVLWKVCFNVALKVILSSTNIRTAQRVLIGTRHFFQNWSTLTFSSLGCWYTRATSSAFHFMLYLFWFIGWQNALDIFFILLPPRMLPISESYCSSHFLSQLSPLSKG